MSFEECFLEEYYSKLNDKTLAAINRANGLNGAPYKALKKVMLKKGWIPQAPKTIRGPNEIISIGA